MIIRSSPSIWTYKYVEGVISELATDAKQKRRNTTKLACWSSVLRKS